MIISIADLVIRDRFDGERSNVLLAGSPGMFIHYMRGDCDADRRCTDKQFPPHLRH